MKLFNRKSQLQRLLENVNDSLDALSAIKIDTPGGTSPGKALKAALPRDKARKAGLDRRWPRRPHRGERRHLFAQAPQGRGKGRFVKLTPVAVFAVGYVVGAKAGRERYAQIVDGVARASRRLEEFSARRPPGRAGHGAPPVHDDARSPEASL